MNNQTANSPDMWINPVFAQWGKAQAGLMTCWLYQDRSYPMWNSPEQWGNSGLVRIVKRALTFPALGITTGTGMVGTAVMDFFGGKNYIVLARTCVSANATQSLETDLVLYEEKTKTGTIIVQEQSLSMVAGTGEWPAVLPIPDFVLGNERRDITVTNNTGTAVNTVRVGYTIAYLDTGR
jgi:hypothetical protein